MSDRRRLRLLFLGSGGAALTWELVWQHHLSLAIGISAFAAAVTIATTMAGMATGAVLGARLLAGRLRGRAWLALGAFELVVGLWGLALPILARAIAWVDVAAYAAHPALATSAQVTAGVLLLAPPTLAMGATIAAMSELALASGATLPGLYALNTIGASIGVLLSAFVVVPAVGMTGAGAIAAALNLAVAAGALGQRRRLTHVEEVVAPMDVVGTAPLVVALLTGASTFVLEIGWFRSLRAAFQSTTDSFAITLFAFLLPIALGAVVARRFVGRTEAQARLLVAGALVSLAACPLVDRFDLHSDSRPSYWATVALRLAMATLVMGPPVLLVSAVLPALLAAAKGPRAVGRLYALNTAGAVLGALGCAWLLLPHVGAYRASIVGAALPALAAAVLSCRRGHRVVAGCAALAVLVVGPMLGSGNGRSRVQSTERGLVPIETHEGPDATVSVARDRDGELQLIIDGFQTTGESAHGHYMAWMGRLPMLAHRAPKRALVICFGTGQTANAVRRLGPDVLDLVEVSPAVLALAPRFRSNEDVLHDPRVRVHLMDGRAWLRRTTATYDVVTLEPMEPHFAGATSLYSHEFYEAARARMSDDGVLAQWVPLHLLPPEEVAAIVRTMSEVFPDAFLWIDPVDRTAILVGRATGSRLAALPQLSPRVAGTDLDERAVRAGVVLDAAQLERLASLGEVITDDNQLLAYGPGRRALWRVGSNTANHALNLSIFEALRR